MWTEKNRPKYNRDYLRYPSDLSDEEWEVIAPLIPPGKSGGSKRRVVLRDIMNGVMYILSTGCQWRYLPKDLPPRSTVHDYLTLWEWEGRSTKYATRFMRGVEKCQNAKPIPPPASSIAKA